MKKCYPTALIKSLRYPESVFRRTANYSVALNSVEFIELVFIFWDLGFENIQETNSALYSLQIGLSNEVSLEKT
jgi:hypothetical protein